MFCIIRKYGSMDLFKKSPWYLGKGDDFTEENNWTKPIAEARRLTEEEAQEIMYLNRKLTQTQRASVLTFKTEREFFLEVLKNPNV